MQKKNYMKNNAKKQKIAIVQNAENQYYAECKMQKQHKKPECKMHAVQNCRILEMQKMKKC